MEPARVIAIVDHLRSRGMDVWLDGGWAVDALLGEQTRAHDDLDLVARLDDVERLERSLQLLGYELGGGGQPLSFELVDAEGHQVDVHPVRVTEAGDGIYRMASGKDWIYPAAGFEGIGSIAGQDVQCLTPEVVMVNHTTGYALDEEHQRDVVALGKRYGIAVPEFERRQGPS